MVDRAEVRKRLDTISMALYYGIQYLSKEVEDFPHDESSKESLQNMRDLYHNVYDAYVPQEVSRPVTIESYLSTQLDPTGGYYGT